MTDYLLFCLFIMSVDENSCVLRAAGKKMEVGAEK